MSCFCRASTPLETLGFVLFVVEQKDCKGNQFVSFKKGKCYTDLLDVLRRDIPDEKIKLNCGAESLEVVNTDDG